MTTINAKTRQEIGIIAEQNMIKTRARMKDLQIPDPFIFDSKKLQPVRKYCTTLFRFYMGKVIPIKGLKILQSCNTYEEEIWFHTSFSRPDKLPTYTEVLWIRENILLPEWTAIQVFPIKTRHVNYHPYTLHLWVNLERNVLPDFDTLGMV